METWSSTDGTVVKNILMPGIFGKKPRDGSKCIIKIENIKILPEKPVSNEFKYKYVTDILDGKEEKLIIIGNASTEIDRRLERGIQKMMVNEQSNIQIKIPPSSQNDNEITVECDICLNSLELSKYIWELTPEEKYAKALELKEVGISLYKEDRYVDAFHKFSKACKIIITLEPIPDLKLPKDLENNLHDLRFTLYNNMAGCHLKRKNYEHVVSLCTKIIKEDCNNVKALFRRGVAYGKSKDVERAIDDLATAHKLEPNNTMIKQEYNIYHQQFSESQRRANEMVRRMFQF